MKKYILFIMAVVIMPFYSLAQEGASEEVPGKFYISKVNRVEKLWVIPPNRRDFMGSRGITKFDYAHPIRPEDSGEDYVITWRYRGKELKGDLILRFEYRTVNTPEEIYIDEYSWPGIKRGTYRWTLKNVGSLYSERGKVDRWKVSLIYSDKVVSEKRSATWRAMEGT